MTQWTWFNYFELVSKLVAIVQINKFEIKSLLVEKCHEYKHLNQDAFLYYYFAVCSSNKQTAEHFLDILEKIFRGQVGKQSHRALTQIEMYQNIKIVF